VDYFDATLRVSKSVTLRPFTIQLFADVFNLFNTRRLNNTGDRDYRLSLHLPKSEAYNNIPGSDKLGDYREPGVEWQPMESSVDFDHLPSSPRVWCYDASTGTYWQYINDPTIPTIRGRWKQVDQAKVDQALKDKAYINMPNPSTYWFLNPRNITFGLSVTFDID
jgi:hypothetical protein